MTNFDIFTKFLALHPNRLEIYDPTPENVQRWQWHIRQRELSPKYAKMHFDYTLIEAIRQERGVKEFKDFPVLAQVCYTYIATMFPGEQVYACGSRVRGDYNDDNNEMVNHARILAGMKPNTVSDFDYFVRKGAVQRGIPHDKFKFDRMRVKLPLDEMVKIPIYQPKIKDDIQL